MKTHSSEILLVYNPDSEWGKRAAAHAKSLVPHLKMYTFEQSPFTKTDWQGIIKSLDIPPKKLLNKSLSEYQEKYKGTDFKEEDWLDILVRNPQLIRAPIGIRGKQVVLCERPTDIHKLTSDEKKFEE